MSAAHYAGKIANKSGLIGFAQVIATDAQTGVVTTWTYDTGATTASLVGLLDSQVSKSSTGTVLRDSENTWQSTTNTGADSTNYYDVTLQQNVTSGNDLSGTAFPSTTVAYTYDAYDNPHIVTTTIKVGSTTSSTETVTNNYTNDAPNWLLAQLTDTTRNRVVGSSNLTRAATFTHDSTTGLITQQVVTIDPTTPSTLTFGYTLDSFGHATTTVISGTGITSRTEGAGYDSLGQFNTSNANQVSATLSLTTNTAFSAAFGTVTSSSDPNSIATTASYDTLGRPTLVTRPDGTKIILTYAYCSGVNGGTISCPSNGAYRFTRQLYAADGTTKIGPLFKTFYDALYRAIADDQQAFNGNTNRVTTLYGSNEQINQVSRPYEVGAATPAYTTFQYDDLNRITQATAPDTSVTTYGYDALVTSVTDANSHTTTTTYNPQGLPATIEDALTHTTTYVYDAFDNMLTSTDQAGNVVTNTYDAWGRRTGNSDPDRGSWSYTYDVLSELTSQTDAKSQTTNWTYDLIGRPLERKEVVVPSGFLYSNWIYDTGTAALGKLSTGCTSSASNATCTSPNSERQFTYDSIGRPSNTALLIGSTTYNYASTYDTTTGYLSTVTYPSGNTLDYQYNSRGYFRKVVQDGSSAFYWQLNSLDAELHPTSQTAGNNIVTTSTYDANTGRVTGIVAGTSNAVANWGYTWDPVGNLLERTDGNADSSGTAEYFCYDALNRLTNYAVGASVTSCTSTGSKTLTYNTLGNIESKTDIGTNWDYPTSVQPHAVTSLTGSGYSPGTSAPITNPHFDYDPNGNMTCIHHGSTCTTPLRSTSWTSFNMVDSVTQGTTSVAITYDDQHSRITQSVTVGSTTTATTYLNDPMTGAMSVRTTTGSTTTWRDYVVAYGSIVAERDAVVSGSTTTQYFTLDHLGSVGTVTDASGTPTHQSFDAWGKRRNADGTDDTACALTSTTTVGFTNQEEVDALCSVNLNARVYDASLGRFLSADPIDNDVYDMQALNRYSYVNNMPLSAVDPTGLDQNCIPSFTPELETVCVTPEGPPISDQPSSLPQPALPPGTGLPEASNPGPSGGFNKGGGGKPTPKPSPPPQKKPSNNCAYKDASGQCIYVRDPSGKLQFDKDYLKKACVSYKAMKKSQDEVTFGATIAGAPNVVGGPVGGWLGYGWGVTFGALALAPPPQGCM